MMDRPIPDWLNVSRETIEKLDHFTAEVLRWNPAVNLVSKASIGDIWARHILDSAQIFTSANPKGRWVDLGSGGGFPGIVMAIMGAEEIVLVESDQRKAAFLRQAAHNLSLPVTVMAKRLDAVQPLSAQTITARALASLTELLAHATPHLTPEGRAIFPKGRGYEPELQQARTKWAFDCDQIASRTDPQAAILVLKNIRRL